MSRPVPNTTCFSSCYHVGRFLKPRANKFLKPRGKRFLIPRCGQVPDPTCPGRPLRAGRVPKTTIPDDLRSVPETTTGSRPVPETTCASDRVPNTTTPAGGRVPNTTTGSAAPFPARFAPGLAESQRIGASIRTRRLCWVPKTTTEGSPRRRRFLIPRA